MASSFSHCYILHSSLSCLPWDLQKRSWAHEMLLTQLLTGYPISSYSYLLISSKGGNWKNVFSCYGTFQNASPANSHAIKTAYPQIWAGFFWGDFLWLGARLSRGQAELEEPRPGNAFGSTARDSGSSVCLNIQFQKSRGQVWLQWYSPSSAWVFMMSLGTLMLLYRISLGSLFVAILVTNCFL